MQEVVAAVRQVRAQYAVAPSKRIEAAVSAADAASAEALAAFVQGFDVGGGVALKGIAEGVENSNYLLITTRSKYILTLYEKRVAAAQAVRTPPHELSIVDERHLRAGHLLSSKHRGGK